MTWPKVEEINANTNAARDEIKGNTDTAKNEIKTYTAEEIAAAIQTLQAATESARDTILANLTSGGAVKKVQRGVISIGAELKTATASISAVDMTKTGCVFLGCVNDGSDTRGDSYKHAYIQLTSSTKVTATRLNASNSINVTTKVSYEVVEFY